MHSSNHGKLEAGKHLALRYNTFATEDNNEPVPCALTGSLDQKSTAYIFCYSFDIVTAGSLEAIHDLTIDGNRVAVYPPFRIRSIDERAIENVPLTAIPHRPGTTSPAFPWGTAPDISLGPEHARLRTHGIRIDCAESLPYEFAAKIANSVVQHIRWRTKQWWINRGYEHPRTHIRHWFHTNELGERIAAVGTFRFFYGPMGFERTLDQVVWTEVGHSVQRGEATPLSWQLFLDAVYSHSTDDLRRSILEVAISHEVLLSETLNCWIDADRVSKARAKKVLHGADYVQHLSRTGGLWARSFERECPDGFRWIKAAWIARGKVAHGKAPLAPLPEGNKAMQLDDLISVFAAGVALRNWLESL
jgi:hypothetical protein